MTVRISLLGPMKVEHDSVDLDPGGGKQATILTALVLGRGRVVAVDRLIDLVWADRPPSKPHVTLRSYISHLRRIIEPEKGPGDRSRLLVTRSPGYALEIDRDAVDLFRFSDAVDRAGERRRAGDPAGAVAELDEALGLWRSDTLESSPLNGFVAEVDGLIERRWQAIEMRFDALLELGRHRELVPDLRALTDEFPTREQPRRQLMLALHRAGRPAEAIEVYQEGLRLVVESTGLDVSTALADLETRILNNDPGLDWHPVADLGPAPGPPAADSGIEPPPGRANEWALIAHALETPAGGLIAITGEPGQGKTDLLEHAAMSARRTGAVVAWARGHAGTESVALGPWRALLTDLVEQVDDETLADLTGPRSAELAMLVPEIGDRRGITPTEARDPLALNDSVARFLRRLSTERPLVLCFDDLHWVDPASVRLLGFVIPTLRTHPATVLATWRDTEPVGEELASGLADLGRLASTGRMELSGLDVEAIRHICDRTVDHAGLDTVADDVIDELHRRTGGNPLFTIELLRAAMTDDGDSMLALPATTSTVNEVISSRIEALPEQCRELLSIGALSPAGFDDQLLAELSGLGDEELLTCVESLLAARLIVEDPVVPTRFQFAHSLIGESLAAQMSGPRKARLHHRIARTLAGRQADIGRLAHHFLQGATVGDPSLAANAALAAAREAAALHDHTGAIDLIERGLAALDHAAGAGNDDDLVRAELMAELAQERKYLEHYTQSHAAAAEAFELARRAGDLDLMVRAVLTYCGQGGYDDRQFGLSWLGYWNPPGPAIEMLRICLDKLPPGPTRTVVLLAYGSELFGEYDDPRESLIVLDDAISEAREHGLRNLLCAALYQKLSTVQRQLDLDQRRATVEEGLELALSIRSPHRELAMRRARMCLQLDLDDLDSAVDEIRLGARAAQQNDDPNLEMFAASMPIALDIYRGRLDRAERALEEAFTSFERMGPAALDLFGIQLAVLPPGAGQAGRGRSDDGVAPHRLPGPGLRGVAGHGAGRAGAPRRGSGRAVGVWRLGGPQGRRGGAPVHDPGVPGRDPGVAARSIRGRGALPGAGSGCWAHRVAVQRHRLLRLGVVVPGPAGHPARPPRRGRPAPTGGRASPPAGRRPPVAAPDPGGARRSAGADRAWPRRRPGAVRRRRAGRRTHHDLASTGLPSNRSRLSRPPPRGGGRRAMMAGG